MKNLNGNQRGVKVEALEKLYVDKSSEKRMLRKPKQKMQKKIEKAKDAKAQDKT